MGVTKYFKKQFQLKKFVLEHESVTDFYLASFQTSRSTLPLLCVRTIVFLGCLAILLTSMIMTGMSINFSYWPIFLTHWGLVFITCYSFFAFVVSAVAYLQGSIEASYELPWYVKAYWVLYNTAVPVAFFITVFYWIFLTAVEEDFAIDPVLDVFIHAVNSVLMLVLVLASRHPTHLFHFYHSLGATIVYLIFSIIYYYAGGLNPFGSAYIYPMLDWSKPGIATITVIGSAIALIVMHIILVLISLLRDAITRSCWRNNRSLSISNDGYN